MFKKIRVGYPDSATLKPCPFCGGEARVLPQQFSSIKGYSIDCTVCGARKNCFSEHEEQVIAEWNARYDSTTGKITF